MASPGLTRRALPARLALGLVVLAALVLLAWFNRQWLDLQRLVTYEQQWRRLVQDHPVNGTLAGVAIYFAVSLVPGTAGKSIVCGWLFGFWRGLLVVEVGLTGAACLSFAISRYLLHDLVHRRFGRAVQYLDRALQRYGAWYVLILRLLHAPYTITNYSLGVTCLSARAFALATAVGLLPGTVICVYAGSRLPTLQQLLEDGPYALLQPQLVAAYVGLALVPLVVHGSVRRWWRGATTPHARGLTSAAGGESAR